MTTRALKKRLRSKDAERIFHELLIADVAISPEMEEMARAAARSAVVEYEDAGVRERTQSHWWSNRVLRRAVVVVCLLALLFAPIMETGSSAAMWLVSMIAELTEDWLVFHPRESPGMLVIEDDREIKKEYDNYASLTAETGLRPLRLHDPTFELDDIEYRYRLTTGKDVTSLYCSKEDGSVVLIRQEWENTTEQKVFLGNQEIRTETWGGIEYYVLEDQIDESVSLYTALEDSFLTIGIENADYVERVMEGLVWPEEHIQMTYQDADTLTAETGIVPLQLDASPFQLGWIEYDRFYGDEEVMSIYTSKKDGSFVTIRQKWGVTSKQHITLQNQEAELRRRDGIDWYILQDQTDNTITLFADMNEYFLMIGVQNEDYVEQVMEGLTLDMSMQ